MHHPRISVVLPAYNGADTIEQAICSVIEQSDPRWELLVTDDASTDATRDVVRRVADPRVRLLEHDTNRGPDAARFTALVASKGDLVAFLDQDDLFLPAKLGAHIAYMDRHPEIGLAYNPFYVVTEPGHRPEFISYPPSPVSLSDLVGGFPLPPSTWVFRRHWALFQDIWDPATMLRGREVVLLGRLFVAGCRFGLVDEVLNVRRVHRGRRFAAPALKCAEERRCQEMMLADPRCDAATRAIAATAGADTCLMWANVALVQGETETGLELIAQAIALDPSLAAGEPHPLADYFLGHAVMEAADPEAQIRRVFAQAARAVPALFPAAVWAVAQAHLLLGARHVLWDRPDEATPHWDRVRALGAAPDDRFLQRLAHELLGFERAHGAVRTRAAIARLGPPLTALGGPSMARRLGGTYHLARAFVAYRRGHHRAVPADVLRGLLRDPREMANRGAWSILVRSALAG